MEKTYYRVETPNMIEWAIIPTSEKDHDTYPVYGSFSQAKEACSKWLKAELESVKDQISCLKSIKKSDL